ncbi:MAG: hypothetical protein PHW60_15890 [Kiritimatiellae bacterium]|nr:hypothetical protein [Kiritimatiellia bacterium]
MENKIMERFPVGRKAPSWRYFAYLAGKFCILLIFTGCVRLRPGIKPVEKVPEIEIHAQYAVSSEPRIGYNTLEVYIVNRATNTIVFTGAELNGKPLPKVESDKLRKLLTVSLSEGEEIPLTDPGFPEDSPVTWWQYYPCNTVKPGGAIEFQVNFKAMPTGRQELRLLRQNGEAIIVAVPRFRQPDKRLTAITYSLDGKRMFVQYASRKVALKKLSINNNNICNFKILQSVEGSSPDLAAFDVPFELENGDVLHVRSEFEDGSRRDALVRVLLGIALDGGFSGGNNEQAIRKEYGLDDYSVVEMLPFDVACSDTRANKKGMSAPALTEARAEVFSKNATRLGAVNYCAAFYPELGNIYGQISDAVYAKPYQLGWGKQPARFIEAEERRALEEAESCQPRPWLWIPDRFNRSGRYMASGELEMLAWLMLEHGSKGIRYHYWNRLVAEIMTEHPWLLTGLAKLNKDIVLQKEILSPLVWVSERTFEKEKVKTYESWSGDKGILILVRNLDYRTEVGKAKGQEPKFNVVPKQNVNIPVSLPTWFKNKKAVDLLSGKLLPTEKQDNAIQIKLDRLDAFRLIGME